MLHYASLELRKGDSAEQSAWKRETAERLLELRAALRDHLFSRRAAEAPAYDRDEDRWLRVATWNIREFDSAKYGGRLPEAVLYIAEIISHFDLVALQEVREDLGALRRVMEELGTGDWSYIATDVTEGTPGNRERMVFIYRHGKVQFRSIAGEITLQAGRRIPFPHGVRVRDGSGLKLTLPEAASLESPRHVALRTWRGQRKLDGDLALPLPDGTRLELPSGSTVHLPDGLNVVETGEDGRIALDLDSASSMMREATVGLPGKALRGDSLQFARTPFLVAFQCGWLKLILCTVHIYYGKGKSGLARRNAEIRRLTEFLADRARSERDSDAENFFFVLGDFNIVGRNHATWESLHTNGFQVPEALQQIPLGSNVARDKAYDQIAYWSEAGRDDRGRLFVDVDRAGIFDFFQHVFRDRGDDPGGADRERYSPLIENPAVDYREWRTYQMSDHLPMWVEVRADFSDDYLNDVAGA